MVIFFKIVGILFALIMLLLIMFIVSVFKQKNILLSYEQEQFQALNSTGITFEFTIQNTNIFGVKRIRKSKETIPFRSDFKATIAKMDSLIGKEIN